MTIGYMDKCPLNCIQGQFMGETVKCFWHLNGIKLPTEEADWNQGRARAAHYTPCTGMFEFRRI
jgi:hypothetical protein